MAIIEILVKLTDSLFGNRNEDQRGKDDWKRFQTRVFQFVPSQYLHRHSQVLS